MTWSILHIPLTLLAIIAVVGFIGIGILVCLKKFKFVPMLSALSFSIAFSLAVSMTVSGAIFLLTHGKHESKMKLIRPDTSGAKSSMFSDVRSAPHVQSVPDHTEMQARVDEAISHVHIDKGNFDKQMQVQINAIEGDVALSSVQDSKPSHRHFFMQILHGQLGTTLVMGMVMFAFLNVCYLFFDAVTRGQFTWSLRIVSLVAFVFTMVIAIQVLH